MHAVECSGIAVPLVEIGHIGVVYIVVGRIAADVIELVVGTTQVDGVGVALQMVDGVNGQGE